MQTDITSKGLQDSEEERGEPHRFRFLCQNIGDTATQAVLTCYLTLSRHYASIMQDGLQIAVTRGEGGEMPLPPAHTCIHLSV